MKKKYIIDGYNLFFYLGFSSCNFSEERENFIKRLDEKLFSLKIKATLVFDNLTNKNFSERGYFNALKVVFSPFGKTADEFILEILNVSNNKNKIIVTSDKGLSRNCRDLGLETCKVEDFLLDIDKKLLKKKKSLKEEDFIESKKEIKRLLKAFEKKEK